MLGQFNRKGQGLAEVPGASRPAKSDRQVEASGAVGGTTDGMDSLRDSLQASKQ